MWLGKIIVSLYISTQLKKYHTLSKASSGGVGRGDHLIPILKLQRYILNCKLKLNHMVVVNLYGNDFIGILYIDFVLPDSSSLENIITLKTF